VWLPSISTSPSFSVTVIKIYCKAVIQIKYFKAVGRILRQSANAETNFMSEPIFNFKHRSSTCRTSVGVMCAIKYRNVGFWREQYFKAVGQHGNKFDLPDMRLLTCKACNRSDAYTAGFTVPCFRVITIYFYMIIFQFDSNVSEQQNTSTTGCTCLLQLSVPASLCVQCN
jgi:hypothetical protein